MTLACHYPDRAMALLSPYAAILRRPGALRFSSAAFLARIPLAMDGLGIVLLISAETGSYEQAGIVAATFAAAGAALTPVGARLVDRQGQLRIVSLLVVVHCLALALLVLGAVLGWHLLLLAVIAALAGGTQPATGSLVRARWVVVLGDHPDLSTAFAFESLLDEVIFIIGPGLAAGLAAIVGAPAPLIVAIAMVCLGCTLLLSQRSTEPPVVQRGPEHAEALIRRPGLIVVVLAMIALGGLFGSVDIVVVAAADSYGARAAAGLILAAYSGGSLLAGLFWGARPAPRDTAGLRRRLLVATGLLTLTSLPFVLAGNLATIAVVAFVSGMAISPTLISAFSLTERLVPSTRLTEGLTWVVSGISLGVAVGAPLAGALIDRGGARAGFVMSALSAVAAVTVVAVGYRALNPTSAGSSAAAST